MDHDGRRRLAGEWTWDWLVAALAGVAGGWLGACVTRGGRLATVTLVAVLIGQALIVGVGRDRVGMGYGSWLAEAEPEEDSEPLVAGLIAGASAGGALLLYRRRARRVLTERLGSLGRDPS